MNQIAQLPKRSLVDSMAAKYDMEPNAFVGAIKATVIKGECSNEQFAAFLMVAKEYDLNPLTKEIYAFPDRGGIQPIVSIDGWMNLINSHPQFDGMEFDDHIGDDGKLQSVECRMYRKDRARHTSVIEYMSECFRPTEPWKKWPNRMLRHKAAIQCARYAFGFSGIMEPDEYERMKDVTPAATVTIHDKVRAAKTATYEPTDAQEGFDREYVAQATETAPVSHVEPENEYAAPPSSPAAVDADHFPGDLQEGVEVSSPASAPSTNPQLVECCRKLLNIAIDEAVDRPNRRGVLETAKDNWKEILPASDHEALKRFFMSADQIIKGNAQYSRVIQIYAEMLEVSEKELGA